MISADIIQIETREYYNRIELILITDTLLAHKIVQIIYINNTKRKSMKYESGRRKIQKFQLYKIFIYVLFRNSFALYLYIVRLTGYGIQI